MPVWPRKASSQGGIDEVLAGVSFPSAISRGREAAWRAARLLSRNSSPWQFEYFKCQLAAAEPILGYAELALEKCSDWTTALRAYSHVPAPHRSVRTLEILASRSGVKPRKKPLRAALDTLCFALSAAVAAAMLVFHVIRFGGIRAKCAPEGALLFAVHGEWTNRTRHVLALLRDGVGPGGVLVLGMPRKSLRAIRADWEKQLAHPVPPAVVPVSWRAVLAATPAMIKGLAEGLSTARQTPYLPSVREHSALIFRVFLGNVMARWWHIHGASGVQTVVFGHTGVADASMLEQSLQSRGSITVHAVHGLGTGPNFAGISDFAAFRCGFDAARYRELGHYGQCVVQEALRQTPERPAAGLTLLSNLAHPMNPGYALRGIKDELDILRGVASVADRLGDVSRPLRWKPHPVIGRLPSSERIRLRQEAAKLGFEELPATFPISDVAGSARWVLSTLSTTVVDLLYAGCLPIVLGWHGEVNDDAAARTQTMVTSAEELMEMLSQLADPAEYDRRLARAWHRIRPARPLEIPLSQMGA